jgi:hypothetical protein
VLIAHIHNGMRLARVEILKDGDFYGEIPGFQGVWAQSGDLETCGEELQNALGDRLVPGLGMEIPYPHHGEIGKEILERILRQSIPTRVGK